MDRSASLGMPADARKPSATCTVCATFSQPHLVPWTQHAVGCDVRAQLLSEMTQAGPPPAA